MIDMRHPLGRAPLVADRSVRTSTDMSWWVSIGAFGATGAAVGGIAWAVVWLSFEGKNPRLDMGRWIGGGTVLGGFAGVVHLLLNSGLL
jgi:hypothetical protein